MKKIYTLVLCVIMIFSSIQVFASDTSDTSDYKNESEKISFFYSLGVFDFEYFVDDPITRKEFAVILTRLLKSEGGLESYNDKYYDDVDPDSYGGLHINFMKNMGIMTGKTASEFYPDDDLTLSEASSALVRMFGYHDKAEAKGGWSIGTNFTASDLGLLKGVKSELSTEYLSAGAMAVMLFNAMNVEFVGNYSVEGTDTVISSGESITLFEDYWEIIKAEGLFNASGNTNILGKSDLPLEDDQIEINKKTYTISEDLYHDYFGFYVEYYYFKDDTVRIPEIIFMSVKNNGEKTRIYSNESPILNAGTIQLDKDGQTSKYKISANAITIYNGTSVLGLENKYMPKSGYIDLISNDGSSSYNVVIIYDFKTFKVKSIIEDKIIFGYDQKFNSESSIELEKDGITSQIIKNGENISISKINAGDVISVAYDEKTGYIIYVSSAKLTGWVDSIESSPYSLYMADKKYYVSSEFKTLVDAKADGTSAIEPGKMYNFSLDFMGNIYGMDELTSEMFYGYLMGVRKEGALSDNVEIRIYSNFSGDFAVYPIAKKCNLNGGGSNRDAIYSELETFLANASYANPPVIKFRINADKEVDKLTTKTVAVNDYTQISDDIIVRSRTADPINNTNKTTWIYSYGYFSSYLSNDGNIFVDTSIPFMNIPTSGDEDEFVVGNHRSILPTTDNQQIPVTFYDLDEFNAPGFVLHFTTSQGANVKVNQNIYGVESISEALDKDGEIVALLNLYLNGSLTKVYTTDDSTLITACKALQKGDFIQYNVDGSGNVCAIEKVFSYHSTNHVDSAAYDDGGSVAERVNSAPDGTWTGIFNFRSGKKASDRDYVRLKSAKVNVPVYQLGSATANLSAFTVYDGEKFYKGNIDAIEEDDIVVAVGNSGRIPRMVVIKNLNQSYDLYTEK